MPLIRELLDNTHYNFDENMSGGLATLARNLKSSLSTMPLHANRFASLMASLSGPMLFVLNLSPDRTRVQVAVDILKKFKSTSQGDSNFQIKLARMSKRSSIPKLAIADEKSKSSMMKELDKIEKIAMILAKKTQGTGRNQSMSKSNPKDFEDLGDAFIRMLQSIKFKFDGSQSNMVKKFPTVFGENPEEEAREFITDINKIFRKPKKLGV